jgi:hypothetical protein
VTSLHDGTNDELLASTPSFGDFVFASNTEPLPVEITRFEGRIDRGRVILRWQTAGEEDNVGFRIQRRRARGRGSGGAWTSVGFVEGAGTTSKPRSYRFTDPEVPYESGAVAYRLQQVDADGSTRLTDPIAVERSPVERVELRGTYPNPARHRATIRYAVPERQDVTLRLYDVLGRRVRTVVRGEKQGRHEARLDVDGLSSGVYFLRLQTDGATRTRKLTVVR